MRQLGEIVIIWKDDPLPMVRAGLAYELESVSGPWSRYKVVVDEPKQVIMCDDPQMLKPRPQDADHPMVKHENGPLHQEPENTGCIEDPELCWHTSSVTTNHHARKNTPVFSGVLKYFPRALAAVAALSQIGNEQHNPGTELHWDRSKSGDEWDALTRHLLEVGTYDTDGVLHSTKVAWRALAGLEKELEQADGNSSIHSSGSYRSDP